VLTAYGYRGDPLSIIEKTELYKRSIGEVTDIVEKEMYTFEDRNGDSLTLRRRARRLCARRCREWTAAQSDAASLVRRTMFRHERPQKGRYRQFHQSVSRHLVSARRISMPNSSL